MTTPAARPSTPRRRRTLLRLAVVAFAIGALGSASPAQERAGAQDNVPGAPTAVTSGPAWRYDAADVAWTAPADTGAGPITRYVVDVTTDGGTNWTRAGWTTAVRGTFPCGTSNARCQHRITALNAAGPGPASQLSPAVTVPNPPYSPAAPLIGATISYYPIYNTDTTTVGQQPWGYGETLDVGWTPGRPGGIGPGSGVADHYVLQQCGVPNCTDDPSRGDSMVSTTGLTYTESGDENYDGWYRVVAYNVYGSAGSGTVEPDDPGRPG